MNPRGITWTTSPDPADGGVTAAAIEAEVVSPERARSLVQENADLRARIGRVEEALDLYRRDALTEERLHGEARRFALAWKETARHLFGAREVVRLACDLETGRADKAEQERDDWKRSAEKFGEKLGDMTARWDKWRDLAENPRPLTADAIESVLHDILPLSTEHLKADDIAGIAFDLHAALTEPARPEGSEDLKHPVIAALAGMDSTRVNGLTQEDIEGLCDRLAREGVRVTEEQS